MSVYSVSKVVVVNVGHDEKICSRIVSLRSPFASPVPKRGHSSSLRDSCLTCGLAYREDSGYLLIVFSRKETI